jgi:hypothetical protein
MKWMVQLADMTETINAYKNVVAKPEWKRPLGRHGHR